MQKILVTGASGFVGRHVVAALSGRARVVTTRENATGGRIDLLDRRQRRALIAAERPDIVVHLAWVTEHGHFWQAPENAAWEAASADLFEVAFACGARRIVGTGSCAEYDWTAGTGIFAEGAPLAPHTAYGAAKMRTAERLHAAASAAGASWAWARLFFLFGPGEPSGRLVPSMLRAAVEGRRLDVGPGETERDVWDARNVGAAIAELALDDAEGAVNVASGQATRFGTLAALVERLAGVSGLIRAGGRSLGPGEPARLVADTRRLSAEVGVTGEIGLEEGLGDYLAALRDAATSHSGGRRPREGGGFGTPEDSRVRGNDA